MDVGYLNLLGPPNSPPPNTVKRLSSITDMATVAQAQKSVTENPRLNTEITHQLKIHLIRNSYFKCMNS